MKKMKKVFAMLLALAMVLGMSMTAFAAPNQATITVGNIAKPDTDKGIDAATVKYARVIEPAATTADNNTGWKFVNNDYAAAYKEALGVDTDVEAIQALIAAQTGADSYGNEDVANAAEIRAAISKASAKVASWSVGKENVENGSASWTVTDEPGIYIIRIDQSKMNYLAMAAYVGFGQMVENSDGTYSYPVMENASLSAKGAPLSVDKTNTDNDAVVAVGDTLTYTIKTTVPYIEAENLTSATYGVKDEITGAVYGDLSAATIVYEDGDVVDGVEIAHTEGATTFTLDLTSVLNADNSNAGRVIVITYSATVTEVNDITNKANAGHINGDVVDSEYGDDEDEVFTGELTITKKDAADQATLSGAGFEVRKSGEEDALWFKAVTKTVGDPAEEVVDYYELVPAGTEGATKMVVTGADGVATVKGLDLGKYTFKEVQAPNGYSINDVDVEGEVKLKEALADGEKVTSADQLTFTRAEMNDTKLSALPSTGGIGTTIFTIAGCLIMVVAAGLFFASRRKSTKA